MKEYQLKTNVSRRLSLSTTQYNLIKKYATLLEVNTIDLFVLCTFFSQMNQLNTSTIDFDIKEELLLFVKESYKEYLKDQKEKDIDPFVYLKKEKYIKKIPISKVDILFDATLYKEVKENEDSENILDQKKKIKAKEHIFHSYFKAAIKNGIWNENPVVKLELSKYDKKLLKEYASFLDVSEKELFILSCFHKQSGNSKKDVELKILKWIKQDFDLYQKSLKEGKDPFIYLQKKGYIQNMPETNIKLLLVAHLNQMVFLLVDRLVAGEQKELKEQTLNMEAVFDDFFDEMDKAFSFKDL